MTGGYGVFAKSVIEPGELIGLWGGRIVGRDALGSLPDEIRHHTVQVEEELFLASTRPDEAPDYINHSCAPNAGLNGQIAIVAMRCILPGEEVTIDYAMCDGSAYDEFECTCGAAICRGKVTGHDWRDPALWKRYAGYFSPYIQRRIDALKRERAPRSPKRKQTVVATATENGTTRRQARGKAPVRPAESPALSRRDPSS
ncbi:SET domain-containing protein [Methyloceanibacter methanicus]|uniref:SET domain-containing protein n=1 Tax=Methyloceanibacter methanicus TaxID=1774968 RepID=UPI000849E4A3|nr:SET domain-containing protein-lysine N-methyltransferase [Methyloceanibacter methanicus]